MRNVYGNCVQQAEVFGCQIVDIHRAAYTNEITSINCRVDVNWLKVRRDPRVVRPFSWHCRVLEVTVDGVHASSILCLYHNHLYRWLRAQACLCLVL